jgi:hypothetical protein
VGGSSREEREPLETPNYIDCCSRPRLHGLRTLYESSHDLESLRQCTSCGGYWFYRFHEYVNWHDGEDDVTSWFTPLTKEEGERLIHAAERAREDLSFLATRASWIDDKNGARPVRGAPDHPWS